jgi:hypothetical protein
VIRVVLGVSPKLCDYVTKEQGGPVKGPNSLN